MHRRHFLKAAAAVALLPRLAWPAQQPDQASPFYVMDTWFWQAEKDLTIPDQIALIKKLGYAGLALSWGMQHAERLAALKEAGLRTPGCYIVVDIDGPYPDHLKQCVTLLKGSGGLVWLALTSKKHKRSDAAGDAAALDILTRCADECKQSDVPGIALYPHVGFWMERMADAIRLASQAKRPEIGVQFNQYHWMAADAGQDLSRTLEAARPYLKGVSINGSSKQPSILPLGEGDYDPAPILKALVDLNYKGSISHQGYSIKGNLPQRLAAAKDAWDQINRKIRQP